MKIFVDETGDEFEQPESLAMPSPVYEWFIKENLQLIRPIQKPKSIVEYYPDSKDISIWLEDLELTKDQAQLIKEAAESLMIFIHEPTESNRQWLTVKAEKASDAIQKGSDG